jgi:hypothetical protein
MKTKNKLLILLLLFPAFHIHALEGKDFFSDVPVTWLGIDFSHAHVVGEPLVTGEEMKVYFFPSINKLLVDEKEKYDIGKAFRKSNVTSDFSMVTAINSAIDPEKIKIAVADSSTILSPENVKNIINEYNYPAKGYGIIFIAEEFNKTKEQGSLIAAVVNMDAKTIISRRRITTAPMGFGFRNYWARIIYNSINHIKTNVYGEWKAEHKP